MAAEHAHRRPFRHPMPCEICHGDYPHSGPCNGMDRCLSCLDFLFDIRDNPYCKCNETLHHFSSPFTPDEEALLEAMMEGYDTEPSPVQSDQPLLTHSPGSNGSAGESQAMAASPASGLAHQKCPCGPLQVCDVCATWTNYDKRQSGPVTPEKIHRTPSRSLITSVETKPKDFLSPEREWVRESSESLADTCSSPMPNVDQIGHIKLLSTYAAFLTRNTTYLESFMTMGALISTLSWILTGNSKPRMSTDTASDPSLSAKTVAALDTLIAISYQYQELHSTSGTTCQSTGILSQRASKDPLPEGLIQLVTICGAQASHYQTKTHFLRTLKSIVHENISSFIETSSISPMNATASPRKSPGCPITPKRESMSIGKPTQRPGSGYWKAYTIRIPSSGEA